MANRGHACCLAICEQPCRALRDRSVETQRQCTSNVPPLDMMELAGALKQMKRGKYADKHQIALEMVAGGGEILHLYLLDVFNTMLGAGICPAY